MSTLKILTTNYNGEDVDITYLPDTGGTINIGLVTLPYDYISTYVYGTYLLFFPNFGNTCELIVNDPSGDFLLQEDGNFLLQEDNSKIEL
jgi:hypothetical protein